MYRPLADEIRPTCLDEIVGQEHILGEDGLLRRIIESGNIPNMIFYGPSGCGKTTVARIIAEQTNRTLHKLNATTAGLSDIKSVIADIDTMLAPNGILLYLDEIQYFNKKQQQSLLEFIENGKITLIASTTENPYFYVYNAVLSRCSVFEFKEINGESVKPAVKRGFEYMEKRLGVRAEYDEAIIDKISYSCGGDVRKALNAVELLFSASKAEDGVIKIEEKDAEILSQRSAMRYDRDGDDLYDIISALQKSIRGSDPDAAVRPLSRKAFGGWRYTVSVQKTPRYSQRGCGACISHGCAYRKGVRRQRTAAWASGGKDTSCRGCGAFSYRAKVKLVIYGDQ